MKLCLKLKFKQIKPKEAQMQNFTLFHQLPTVYPNTHEILQGWKEKQDNGLHISLSWFEAQELHLLICETMET